MRIWHEELIPKLCRQHLLAVWREGLGAYKIVCGEVDGGGYKKHPAIKEFLQARTLLFDRLMIIREEMLKRGYKPKELPFNGDRYFPASEFEYAWYETYQWQTLEEQIEVLKSKGCNCQV